jgi:hypothetical protein
LLKGKSNILDTILTGENNIAFLILI